MSAKFPHLFSPGRIGPVELRNRIVLAPMGTYMAGLDGHMSERHKRFYEERARGGAGLLTVEVAAIDWPRGAVMMNQLALSDDAFISGLRDLTDRVHAHGAKISVQLQHGGKMARKDIADGRPLSVPSATITTMEGMLDDVTAEEAAAMVKGCTSADPANMFRELDEEEILRLIGRFADAAERAKRAGFDAVEIHAGHGYLVHEFLSPHCNSRTDRWGGPLENRARFLCEILRETRRQVGSDMAVWCRLDGEEKDIAGGIEREAAVETARLAVAAGADAIHVTRYGAGTGIGFTSMIVHEVGELLPYAQAVKKAVTVPVIAVGRLLPEVAERAIADGQADFVAMGRQMLADPELPNKLAQGRREDVRPCIHCYTCVGQIFINEVVKCAVNPACARETEFALTPAPQPKRVLVVGGGTAGMEAARIAALRGHTVTLCEKNDRLGGTLWFAALVYEPNGLLLEHLEGQMRTLPIELKLGVEVTPALVQALKPDVALVAVGARRQPPPIPGVERANVFSGDDLRSLMTGADKKVAAEKLSLAQRAMLKIGSLAGISDRVALSRELSRHWMPLGRRVVVIGGGLVGLELAEFLVERDRQVTVIEEGPAFAKEMAIPRRWRELHILREHHVSLLAQARVEAITDAGVVYTKGGKQQTAPADSVILASGVQENRGLAEALAGFKMDVHLIGDCKGVGYIEGALLDANRVARQI